MDKTKNQSETEGFHPLFVDLSKSAPSDPAKIGRYRIIQRLGQGGFGRVYLAQDDDLDRSVAVKVPNPERVAGPEDIEAFLTEARILAKLDHPNIVRVHEFAVEQGTPFLAMDHAPGSTLRHRHPHGTCPSLATIVACVSRSLPPCNTPIPTT